MMQKKKLFQWHFYLSLNKVRVKLCGKFYSYFQIILIEIIDIFITHLPFADIFTSSIYKLHKILGYLRP